MRRSRVFILVSLMALAVAVWQSAKPTQGRNHSQPSGTNRISNQYSPVTEVPVFMLIDDTGLGHLIRQFPDKKGIVLLVKAINFDNFKIQSLQFNRLQQEYQANGFAFYAINSVANDDRAKIAEERVSAGLHAPILMDQSQAISQELNFHYQGEFAVIDVKSWHIVQRGFLPLDLNALGGLKATLNAIGSGRPIEEAKLGANSPEKNPKIDYLQSDFPLSYTKEVGRLLAGKCVRCHNESTGIKTVFRNYSDVLDRLDDIKKQILVRRMPPMLWDPVVNPKDIPEIFMSIDQKRKILEWIRQGARRGRGPDPIELYTATLSARSKKEFPGAPYTVTMEREVEIPEAGLHGRSYSQLGGPVPHDMWVVGTRLETTNPKLLTQSHLFVLKRPLSFYLKRLGNRPNDGCIPVVERDIDAVEGITNPYLAKLHVYTQGLPEKNIARQVQDENLGFFIPKGSFLVLENSYEKPQVKEFEKSTLTLFESINIQGIKQIHINPAKHFENTNLSIPPGAVDYQVEAESKPTESEITIIGLNVHMHRRGKSARIFAELPNGHSVVLGSIPFVIFSHDVSYYIPLNGANKLPKGTKIKIKCWFDNSANNPGNPDPNAVVNWGYRIREDEMCLANLVYFESGQSSSLH